MPHTPGPWTIEEYGDDECPALVIHKDTESRVCFMATPGSQGDPEVITADAKLISAAPELLASCVEFLPILQRQLESINPGGAAEASKAFQVASARVGRMQLAILKATI